ncbi:MAG: LamG domain-containing protein, partial [Planctomycetota bacterium]
GPFGFLGTHLSPGDSRIPYTVDSLNDDSWHNVCVTLRNGDIGGYKLYLDGTEVGQSTYAGILSNWHTIKIGGENVFYPKFFKGLIDEVAIYDRALSADQIKTRYQALAPAYLHSQIGLSGLIGYWKFDEGNGNIAYDSVGQKHGTIHGAKWTTGQIGGALDFDGDDGVYLEPSAGARSPLNIYNTDLTISSWIKIAGSDNAWRTIVARWKVLAGAYWLSVYKNRPSIGTYKQGPGHWMLRTDEVLDPHIWYHVVGVFDRGSDKGYVYVNGVEEAHGVMVTDPLSNDASTKIGCRSNTSDLAFDGSIDEVRIYNRALSPEEIEQLYEESAGGPLSHWKFDEGTGSIAHDSVGKNHGTIHGATWTTGKVGGALSFDGDGDVQTTLNIDQNGSTDITMMAWIYPTNKSTRQQHVVSSDNGGFDWSILRRHGKWHAFTGDGAWYSGFREDVDKWQHVAVVFKTGKDVIFYKNGEGRSKGSTPSTDPSSNHIAIGNNPGYRSCLVGKIDEVRIYNKALSAEEIQQLYRAAAGTYEKPKSTGWVDILKLIDVERDARAGPWRLENGALTGFAQSTLETTYELPAEYDVLWEFESNSTAINLLLASPAGKRFEWMMKGWSHNLCAIRDVGRKRANVNETTTVYPLASAVRYVAEVRVRKDGFVALIDGEEILNYKTDWSNIEVWDHWHQFELKPRTLGIWLHKHWTKTHR